MSELRSAIEGLRAESLTGLPDARIEEDFEELERASELIEVERLRRLAEIDRRRLFERDGYLSAVAWLADRFREAWGRARERVRVARALEEMTKTREALEDGDISMSAARVLVEAREADSAEFARSETLLVDAARIHSVSELRRGAAYWRQAVERAQGVEKLRERRRLHASVSFMGDGPGGRRSRPRDRRDAADGAGLGARRRVTLGWRGGRAHAGAAPGGRAG